MAACKQVGLKGAGHAEDNVGVKRSLEVETESNLHFNRKFKRKEMKFLEFRIFFKVLINRGVMNISNRLPH